MHPCREPVHPSREESFSAPLQEGFSAQAEFDHCFASTKQIARCCWCHKNASNPHLSVKLFVSSLTSPACPGESPEDPPGAIGSSVLGLDDRPRADRVPMSKHYTSLARIDQPKCLIGLTLSIGQVLPVARETLLATTSPTMPLVPQTQPKS